MFNSLSKNDRRLRIHARIRKQLVSTSERPRLSVYRSLHHIYAQIIDDAQGRTLVTASSIDKNLKIKNGGNIDAAKRVGAELARRALEKGISTVVFDRGGYKYHGRVRAVADAAREAGLKF